MCKLFGDQGVCRLRGEEGQPQRSPAGASGALAAPTEAAYGFLLGPLGRLGQRPRKGRVPSVIRAIPPPPFGYSFQKDLHLLVIGAREHWLTRIPGSALLLKEVSRARGWPAGWLRQAPSSALCGVAAPCGHGPPVLAGRGGKGGGEPGSPRGHRPLPSSPPGSPTRQLPLLLLRLPGTPAAGQAGNTLSAFSCPRGWTEGPGLSK